jgi:heme a synthase
MASKPAVSALLTRGLPWMRQASGNVYAPTGKWILGTAGLVVGMIHVGGVTRLTQSGLSMTTWSPLGSLPPITREEWEREFERYKQYPEWQQRQSMTLTDFQFIYGWEYGHRMLGRVVGVCFVLPWMYFTMRAKIPPGYQKRMVGLLAMGGTQGLVGWWMVQSGLTEDRRNDKREIRVRPIRLTAHLTMALATYGALVWTGLELWSIPHGKAKLQELAASLGKESLRQASVLRTKSWVLSGLTFVTVASGALVAGNDAGRAYNTYPKMGDEWIPSEIMELSPWHRNFIENSATVQFNHRLLGSTTAITAITLAAIGLSPSRAGALTPQARKGLYAVAAAATAQASLGVVTLLTYVPISLAAIHQLGSVVVFTSSLYLSHALRYARPSLVRTAAATTRPTIVEGSAAAAKSSVEVASSAAKTIK